MTPRLGATGVAGSGTPSAVAWLNIGPPARAKEEMPTSHHCNGEWRDGPVSACPEHQKLSKKQTSVHRGVGEPGGTSSAGPTADAGSSKSEASTPEPSSSESGSAES